jgi:hypothetical protein
MSDAAVAATAMPWYRTLNRTQWRALIASNLGWCFDGYEIYGLIRRGVPESPLWEQAAARRQAARERRRSGAAVSGEDVALTRFTLVDLLPTARCGRGSLSGC